MVNQIGIMQGRLLPPEDGRLQCFPRSRWAEEFKLAAMVPVAYVEWIFDQHGLETNPLMIDNGVAQLRDLMSSSGVSIRSVCADYFMEYPLVRCGQSAEILSRLLDRCHSIGVQRVVLPFVDNSAITPDEFDHVIELLHTIAEDAAHASVEIHLETSLPPLRFAELIKDLPRSVVKVNYDSGNSASLGYAVGEEFAALGARIGSVHIKDRTTGGGTVPLGCGNADFGALFQELRKISYSGDFTLQVARGNEGDEVNWARHNVEFMCKYWTKAKT